MPRNMRFLVIHSDASRLIAERLGQFLSSKRVEFDIFPRNHAPSELHYFTSDDYLAQCTAVIIIESPEKKSDWFLSLERSVRLKSVPAIYLDIGPEGGGFSNTVALKLDRWIERFDRLIGIIQPAPPPALSEAPPRTGSAGSLSLTRSSRRYSPDFLSPGSAIPPPSPAPAPREVEFLVAAPAPVMPNSSFAIELWVSPAELRDAMVREATRDGRMTERAARSGLEIAPGTVVTVTLALPDFVVEHPAVEKLAWNGKIANVGFLVSAQRGLPEGSYTGMFKLAVEGLTFASIAFDLSVAGTAGERAEPMPSRLGMISRGFASYSSEDRAEVLRRVQGMQSVGVEMFVDTITLRAGADWERTLYSEIDRSDRLFLFWSREAAKSPWVEREWRYGLERRGIDFIDPLPLEDPRVAKPPKELRAKHFNDMLLAHIRFEEERRAIGGALSESRKDG